MASSSVVSTGSLTDKHRVRNGTPQTASRRSAIVWENKRKHTKVNLSLFIFTSTAPLQVYLQRALATINYAREKQ